MGTPSEARDLALYFFKLKDAELEPKEVQKSIAQVKLLFKKGYTYEEIKGAMERYKDRMYSIGYLFKAIDSYIGEEILKEEKEKELKTIKDGADGDNKEKYKRFNNKSWFREKCNLDLFKEPGNDK